MLNTPVRYCGNVMTSPGFKRSWKKRKSTRRNPTMSTTASARQLASTPALDIELAYEGQTFAL